jgi:membrane-bound lytic murein transglycosylase D
MANNNIAQIGTPDNPTMDGGYLNDVDALKNNKHLNSNLAPTQKSQIDDEWASDKTIETLLDDATTREKIHYVIAKAKSLQLPATVALLPIIESRYQDNATSSKGAAGSWQLMPSIAHDYGIDDASRYCFKPATDVALHHLKNLHSEFGNWELVFAAYNTGSHRLNVALKENPTASSIDELALPMETKQYIHRIKNLTERLIYLNISRKTYNT